MALQDYRRKRDFAKTPEPSEGAAAAGGAAFVIQKHAATRLHYDLRLELDGVLKSWAVAKGPSLVAGDKRLAIEVEDHPISYGSFEGNIPKGQYGGGAVIVWDNGSWSPEGDPRKGLAKGHLRFALKGQKLAGLFDLVRINKKPKDRQQPWLLIKVDDAHARGPDRPDILDEQPASVLTARTIEDVAANAEPRPKPSKAPAARAKQARLPTARSAPVAGADGDDKSPARPAFDPSAIQGVEPASLPNFIPPALASLSERAPPGGDWVHEIKLDGYRLQARIDHGHVQLRTRNGLDWTGKFGPLPSALADLPVTRAILDGEAVVETPNGVTSYAELKVELSSAKGERFLFYAFDILHLDGYDLTAAGFQDRRALLEQVFRDVPAGGRLRLSEIFETEGAVLAKHACRLGLEGIISKRRTARYASGRSKVWLKTKCSLRDEFIVVGYGLSTVSRRAIGSLALGYYKDGVLSYAGKVGTGFSQTVAEELWQRLEPLGRPKPAVANIPADADIKGVRWLEPRHVADIEYKTWTGSGLLRHASFQGLRDDKSPEDLLAEPGLVPSAEEDVVDHSRTTAAPAAWTVRLTHPDRVYWPDAGVSKLGLADFYASIWPWIEPYVVNRPLSLLRCPGGGTDCFFQKHAWGGFDVKNIKKGTAGDDEFLWIDSLDGLIALVQAAVLEIHPWGSPIGDPEKPDMLIFDLDPGEGLAFTDVEAAAIEVREKLAAIGLRSFLKTTGGKGLHVVVPIEQRESWSTAKTFTQKFVEAVAAAAPDRYLTKMSKAARQGRIFLDYLRNGRGQTAVGAYSTRARPGAPVSTPIAWEEVGTGILPSHFTVLNLGRRLGALEIDPWADMPGLRQKLPPLSKLK